MDLDDVTPKKRLRQGSLKGQEEILSIKNHSNRIPPRRLVGQLSNRFESTEVREARKIREEAETKAALEAEVERNNSVRGIVFFFHKNQ